MCANFLLDIGHCDFYIFECRICWILFKSVVFFLVLRSVWSFRGLFLSFSRASLQSVPNWIVLLRCGSSGTLPNVPSYMRSFHSSWWKWTAPFLVWASGINLVCLLLYFISHHTHRTGLDSNESLCSSPWIFVQLSFPGFCLANFSHHGFPELWCLSYIL